MTTPSRATKRAIRDHLDNARRVGWVGDGRGRRRVDRRADNVPMPPELVYLHIAERFHQFPWDVEEAPADRLAYWIGIMAIEARVKDQLADIEWDDVLVGFWDEDEW